MLVDGSVGATWSVETGPTRARLVIRALDDINAHRDAIRAEGVGLLGLLAPDAPHVEVTFA